MDEAILLWVNSRHVDYMDEYMWMLTYRFTWIPMYIAIAYAVVRTLGWKRGMLFIVSVALTILLADQVCSHVIRPWAERLRPSNVENPLSAAIHIVRGYRGAPYGMPSCHAANTMALLTIMLLRFRGRLLAVTMTVWMLSQVYSRMYLGVHYPTDLLVGAAVGGMSAGLVFLLYGCVVAHLPVPYGGDASSNGRLPLRVAYLPATVFTGLLGIIAVLSAL